ncbi:beta-1,3-glucanase 1 [Dorcoceras hygrometricum]|uniref:Beta-1,3-glucanase 1 n=1 Tax=Dorcoceras hygrometricum TaxID=472368 RepID=A0A2Z7AJL0_9LAMI|nr:beta-1,3-glucanase 1 [Dorcoceras hygrometricum]
MTFRVVRTNQYNQDLGLIHSTNGNHLESPKEGSSIDHQRNSQAVPLYAVISKTARGKRLLQANEAVQLRTISPDQQHTHKATLLRSHTCFSSSSTYISLENSAQLTTSKTVSASKLSAYTDQLRFRTLFSASRTYISLEYLTQHALLMSACDVLFSFRCPNQTTRLLDQLTHPALKPRLLHWTGSSYSYISSRTQHGSTHHNVSLSACTRSDPDRNYSASFQAEFYKLYIQRPPSRNKNFSNSKQLALLRSAQATEPARTRAV